MRDKDGELCSRYVNGYLVAIPVAELPDKFFCSKSIIALLEPYGFKMKPLRYVNAGRRDVPCLYSLADYKGGSFAVESYETLKSMASSQEGCFTVFLSVENERGISPSLNAQLAIELSEMKRLTLSPLVDLD